MDLTHGGKVMLLKLDGVTVIQADPTGSFLGSGSYLMYPWVNRVEKYHKKEFEDGAGLPLHGLYATRKRNLDRSATADAATLVLTCEDFDEAYPKFKETFVLTTNSLTINFESEATEKDVLCFGYHPYLQLNDIKLTPQNVSYEGDLAEYVHLQPNLLPVYPFVVEPARIMPGEKFDNLFRGGSRFSIVSNHLKKKLTIQSKELKYWQVYTPDEHRIAVEPMSFCGNIFAIREQQGEKWVPPPTSGSIQISVNPL